ncbi:MAG TPA: choice-of-anchor Q domain-containing protein [Chitinophagaceae bacterium]|nr:choice-of-anchor Q domain-containing protein [Chitinophagaceae bacterium]
MKILPAAALSAFVMLTVLIACRKNQFITSPDAGLSLSADTLHYDTVFTSAGSVTQSFKILNPNNQALRIRSVRLMGGTASAYRINADGMPGPEADNLELAAGDSLYVFVQVRIDPTTANQPFVIRDSIQVSFNGNTRVVQLEAWGQNAHYLRNHVVSTDENWTNDLPYVVLGSLTVQAGSTLHIGPGCRIYLHADAPLLVDGSLRVSGGKDSADRVYFRGDRLDDPYRDYPAAWPGIYFRSASQQNRLDYAVIRNAYQALALQEPATPTTPVLELNQCLIDNAYDAGIIALHSSIRATNCLISNCGKNLVLAKGGDYSFVHCTVASYSNNFFLHKDPVLFLSNYVSVGGQAQAADLQAVFRNCIFWGDDGTVDDEVVTARDGSAAFQAILDHALLKVKTPSSDLTTNQVLQNLPPQFDSINASRNYYNFRLKPGSPALDAGVDAGVTLDLDGNPRPVGLPDLGCYEHP